MAMNVIINAVAQSERDRLVDEKIESGKTVSAIARQSNTNRQIIMSVRRHAWAYVAFGTFVGTNPITYKNYTEQIIIIIIIITYNEGYILECNYVKPLINILSQ